MSSLFFVRKKKKRIKIIKTFIIKAFPLQIHLSFGFILYYLINSFLFFLDEGLERKRFTFSIHIHWKSGLISVSY